jgi:hypothetical protein
MSKKEDTTVYTVQLTGEQIHLIRKLYFRNELIYATSSMAQIVQENGKVHNVPFHHCYFCYQASYQSVEDIPHTQECVIPRMHKDYDALNAQFTQVLNEKKKE